MPGMSAAPTPTTPLLVREGPPRLRARCGALDLPWLPLGTWPTPVERLEAVSRHTGADVWVKRDDRSGTLYGGNKVRKLELLLAHALARGRRTIVTLGAYGSHHALATALYGRAVGLSVELALYPQPLTPHVLDDLLLDHAAGATLWRIPHPAVGPLYTATLAARADRGEVISPGGSSFRGTLGHVEAALELAGQIEQGLLPRPDALVVAAGTCGTAAGLAVGLELAGLQLPIVAVRVVPPTIANQLLMRRLRVGCWRLLREVGFRSGKRPPPCALEIDPHELGGGYGVDTPAARESVARFADDGIELETTYTGKAAAALLRLARGAYRGKRLLFWHTFSSVDQSARLATVDARALPPSFHAPLRAGNRLA